MKWHKHNFENEREFGSSRAASRRTQQADGYHSGLFLRNGFAVFVNHVSKRIHPTSLREDFSEYGKVQSVFIAYHNHKRLKSPSTFAFVRFAKKEEALKAVNHGNNRQMDGFVIKVFLEEKRARGAVAPTAAPEVCQTGSTIKKRSAPNGLRDNRSYKEVLLEKFHQSSTGMAQPPYPKVSVCATCKGKVNLPSSITSEQVLSLNLELSSAEDWLKVCLVGQIKGMYDACCVQQALRADSFKVEVCTWSGFYAIIRFEKEEQIPIFWYLRDSLIRTWFSDIDYLKNFKKENKLKVWVCMEGIPLSIWHDSVFSLIGSRMGSVVRIDDETSNKSKLDVARIFIVVGCLSDIPPFVTISMFGKEYRIRLSTSEYEDERCWLDDGQLNSQFEEEVMCLTNDINHENHDAAEGMSPKVSDSGSQLNSPTAGIVCSSGGDIAAGGLQGGQDNSGPNLLNEPSKSNNLIDVPIQHDNGPAELSDNSTSCDPTIDANTGIFTIKPKLIKQKNNGSMSLVLRSNLEKMQNWSSFSPAKFSMFENSRKIKAKKRMKSPNHFKPVEIGFKNSKHSLPTLGSDSDNQARNALSEAIVALEVCESLGLSFDANQKEVIHRFMEIDREARV
ncbi:hypothetical protein HRI_004476700 [Hibiscus trionum]|uniref:RRM domain-containing protein n=1 Tax=Hibiscus trionum TaxID=183268 RepID=A0A9W7J4S0_HIBTR|nr:hypothetical protein HRI_004476700 [Hibiscus trionum]